MDLTAIALGVPIVVSGICLICFSLRGMFAAIQLKRDPTAQPKPFTKLALVAFSLAAAGLWVSLFISFFAAPVFKELCGNYHCGVTWPERDAAAAAGLECYGAHVDLRDTCTHPDVCCGCRTSWSGGGTPELVCKQTVEWACDSEHLEATISYVVCFFAVALSSASVLFYLIVRGRCQHCVDVGDCCEAAAEVDSPKGPDVGTLGPNIEDEPSLPASPSVRSQSQGPKASAVDTNPLTPSSGARREVSSSPKSSQEPPVPVQYEFSV